MSEQKLWGKETPRLFTRPKRELTPETTLGFELIEFARNVCGIELMPWQKWVAKAMLELNEDGSLRFDQVLVIVGRQSGKTELLKVLTLWTMLRSEGMTVLAAAHKLEISKTTWEKVVEMAETNPALAKHVADIKRSSGGERLIFRNRSTYRVSALNGGAGRGLSVDLLVLDELREMKSWEPYTAITPTTTARKNSMIVAISNAGTDMSVVLNSVRKTALDNTDESLGIFEWSAPDRCELDDREAWAQANPGLGYVIKESKLAGRLATLRAVDFRTEHLCQRVASDNTAIDLDAWSAAADPNGTLANVRERVALCLDASPDLSNITLAAAALTDDGRVRVQLVGSWTDDEKSGTKAANDMRAALPDLLARIKPAVFGWLPNGPAAALAADLRATPKTEPIKDVPAACMAFAEFVSAGRVLHPNDPRLNAQVSRAGKKASGNGWRFIRAGSTHVDAVFAAAGAVHLARGMTAKKGKPRILVANAA